MSGDKNLALVMKMGSPRELGYNPIAPRSHRWTMDVSIKDEVLRLHGWALWRTVDLDPHGKKGPIKKSRTYFAHDVRCHGTKSKFLGIEHAAEDLGMTLANAIDALRRAVDQGKLLVDEDGRISPNGDAPEPMRTKGETTPEDAAQKNENLFCAENFPPPLVERFQQLSINRAAQYRDLYSKIPKPLLERLKKLGPEKRTADTWEVLEGLEYREQLKADAMTLGRRAGDFVMEQIYAKVGFEDEETRGRNKKPLDQTTVELRARVSFQEFSAQKKAPDSVQKGKPILNGKAKGPVQNQPSLFDFSDFYSDLSSEKSFTAAAASSSSSEASAQAGRQEEAQPEPPARLPLEKLRKLFPKDVLLNADLQKLDSYFTEQLGSDYTPEAFIEMVEKRAKRTIGAGVLFDYVRGLPKDFCEITRSIAAAKREEEQQRAQREAELAQEMAEWRVRQEAALQEETVHAEAAPKPVEETGFPLSAERRADLEKRIAEIKAWLEQNADGNEIGLRMYRRDLRRCERELAGERKSADSESHTKSKKAGQA